MEGENIQGSALDQSTLDDKEAKDLLEALEIRKVKDGVLSSERETLLTGLQTRFSEDKERSDDYKQAIEALALRRQPKDEEIQFKICQVCGKQSSGKDAKFCSRCGTNLETGETLMQRKARENMGEK